MQNFFVNQQEKKWKLLKKNIRNNEANFEIINKQIKLRLILFLTV